MKKTLLSMALTVCLLFSLTATAFAETTVTGSDSATTTITYHVDSQFMVYIPETLDLTYMDKENPYYFTAGMMELEENNSVEVLFADEKISMTNSKGDVLEGYFYRSDTDRQLQTNDCVAEFTDGTTTCSYGIYYNMAGSTPHAGTYTGTTTFQVMLR